MIVRIAGCVETGTVLSGWKAFAASQDAGAKRSGYVSQPAHARLAGRLAAGLTSDAFGHLPAEVIEAVALHDTGWSAADLAALEAALHCAPLSFLDIPSQQATDAWGESIRAAEKRSPLQAILTSRHFCLLAPLDGDAAHENFMREETFRRGPLEGACGVAKSDLDRYTAALGFCDVLSLLMCSGLVGRFEVPLAHPAHAEARSATKVVCNLGGSQIGFNRRVLQAGTRLFVNAWTIRSAGRVENQIFEWGAE